MRNPDHLHNVSACISREDLIRYLNGQTDKKETRRIELHISECMLCGDAVEGFQKKGNFARLPSEFEGLEKEILKKYAAPKSGIFPLWQKFSIAASILVLFGFSLYIINLQFKKTEKGTDSIVQNEVPAEPKVTEETPSESPKEETPVLADNQKPLENQQLPKGDSKKETSPAPVSPPDIETTKTQEAVALYGETESKITDKYHDKPKDAKKESLTVMEDTRLKENAVNGMEKPTAPPVPEKAVSTSRPAANMPSAPVVTPGNYYEKEKDEAEDIQIADVVVSSKKNRAEKKSMPSKTESYSLDKQTESLEDVKATEFSLYQQGINEKKNKNYQKAIELLSSVPYYDTKYEDAQWAIAECYEKLGDKKNASAIYDAMASRKSKYANKAKKAAAESKK
ncbi:MAG: hypothetical protein K1X92_18040 [Bacteroidia bacterium]|nr:hypothetical protein [Bacteroidia bacterium]